MDAINVLAAVSLGPILVVNYDCWNEIESHLSSSRAELGGLLMGNVYNFNTSSGSGGQLIQITQSVRSKNFVHSPVSLEMDAGIGIDVSKLIAADLMVVGWYHSHPDLGAFFSGTDRRTQKYFSSVQYWTVY